MEKEGVAIEIRTLRSSGKELAGNFASGKKVQKTGSSGGDGGWRKENSTQRSPSV